MTSELAISPINFEGQVKAQVRAPNVLLCDVTLRDGELAVPGGFRLKDYIQIAHLLDEIGIPQIQVSYPGVYPEHKAAATALKKEGLKARLEVKVQGGAKNWQQQINDCLDTGADRISLQFVAAPRYQRMRDPNWDEDRHIEAIHKAVSYGKHRGGEMEVTGTDGSRGELPFLLKYFKAVVESGAVAGRLNESVPAMSPAAFKYLIGKIKEVMPIPLGVHCHNHWGLGLANACAAVEAGAEIVDACVNGLAGHAGNVALDEAVMTFQYLYGFDLGLRPQKLTAISKLLEEVSGQAVATNKPVVGYNAYAHSGHHPSVRYVMDSPITMESFPPELVGNERRFPLQWDTSDIVISYVIDALKIETGGLNLNTLRNRVIEFARKNRREMKTEEFLKLVDEIRA